MAKQRSFADKTRKVKWTHKCFQCGEPIKSVRLSISIAVTGGCQFKNKMVKTCKCRSLDDYISGKI